MQTHRRQNLYSTNSMVTTRSRVWDRGSHHSSGIGRWAASHRDVKKSLPLGTTVESPTSYVIDIRLILCSGLVRASANMLMLPVSVESITTQGVNAMPVGCGRVSPESGSDDSFTQSWMLPSTSSMYHEKSCLHRVVPVPSLGLETVASRSSCCSWCRVSFVMILRVAGGGETYRGSQRGP